MKKKEIKRGPLWQWNKKSYLQGMEELNAVDNLGHEMERKWGAQRLRLLAPPALREKFDSQRYKLNEALFEGDLQNLTTQCRRMRLAWETLDRTASEGGASHHPDVWEIAMPDGSVMALVRTDDDMTRTNERLLKIAAGRKLTMWSLEEVARIVTSYGDAVRPVADIKAQYLGSIVQALTARPQDAPSAIEPFDDPIPF